MLRVTTANKFPTRRGADPTIDLRGERSAAGDLDPFSFEAVQKALAHTKGNITQAARALGISRRTFQRYMKRGPEPPAPAPPAPGSVPGVAPPKIATHDIRIGRDPDAPPAGTPRPKLVRPRDDFTVRQMKYVTLRAAGVPAREAARQAGYNPGTAYILEARPAIIAAIDRLRIERERQEAVRLRHAGGPAILAPHEKPAATQLIDGIAAASGPIKAGAFGGPGKRDLGMQLARDLSTCTRDEIESRWSIADRAEAEGLMARAWADIVPADHHPWFFLAQRCWFDNVANDPKFLYAPLHRDKFLAPVFRYIYDPAPSEAGLLYLGSRWTYKTSFSHGVVPMGYVLRGFHIEGFHRTVVLRHHKLELASDNMVLSKDKFRKHPWLRAVWPDACPPENTRDFGTASRFSLPWVPSGVKSDPTYRAIGLTGTDTGRHPDLDVGDDLVTEEHLSRTVRDDAKARYQAKRYQQGAEHCRELNTGTPYHRMDLWSMMINSTMDGRPMYRVIVVPAHLPESLGGGLAHPFKLNEKFLEKMRLQELANSGNEDFYYLQFECTYRLTRSQATEDWWLRDCSVRDVPEDAFLIITLDPCWKGDKNYGEGDSASMQVWALVRRGAFVLRYLIDGVHSNELSSADGERELFRLMHKYGVRVIAPELREGSTFRANIIQQAGSLGIPIVVLDLRTKHQSKSDRIGVFLKECEAGRVFLCTETDPALLEAYRAQFKNWPQIDHDDALDAAAYTCDPAILDAWAPAWGAGLRRGPGLRRSGPDLDAPRTRYTLL